MLQRNIFELFSFIKIKNAEFNGEQQKKNHYLLEDEIENLFGTIICDHSASLVMPKGDLQDGFFYLTLRIDS